MREYDNYRPEYADQTKHTPQKSNNILILLFIISLIANGLLAILVVGLVAHTREQEAAIWFLNSISEDRFMGPAIRNKPSNSAQRPHDPNDPLNGIPDPLNIHNVLRDLRQSHEEIAKRQAEKVRQQAKEQAELAKRKNCYVREGNAFKNCDDPN